MRATVSIIYYYIGLIYEQFDIFMRVIFIGDEEKFYSSRTDFMGQSLHATSKCRSRTHTVKQKIQLHFCHSHKFVQKWRTQLQRALPTRAGLYSIILPEI